MSEQNDRIAKLNMEIGMALHSMSFLIPDAKLQQGIELSKRIENAVFELNRIAGWKDEQKD